MWNWLVSNKAYIIATVISLMVQMAAIVLGCIFIMRAFGLSNEYFRAVLTVSIPFGALYLMSAHFRNMVFNRMVDEFSKDETPKEAEEESVKESNSSNE